jgi:predicted 2-oxoglutarate/Fe(II)-dependent dioxygenase YbiX
MRLRELGATAIPEVLSADSRATLLGALASAPGEPTAPYSPATMQRERDPSFVSSLTSFGTSEMRRLVEDAVDAVLPRLERFWERPLELNPELHFLTYRTGGYIRPHKDVIVPTLDAHASRVAPPAKIRERLVVFSIFLNDDFEGGEFSLVPGFPVPPYLVEARPGTMLAFRSDLGHGVRTVTAGTRYSVTGWLRAPTRPGKSNKEVSR